MLNGDQRMLNFEIKTHRFCVDLQQKSIFFYNFVLSQFKTRLYSVLSHLCLHAIFIFFIIYGLIFV